MTTFEKSYFELPVSNKKSQCILDLESGKISICEVPLEYRNADCYMYAMQYIHTSGLEGVENKIERELVKTQILTDLMEAKKQKNREREAELYGLFEGYFCYDGNDMLTVNLISANGKRKWTFETLKKS